MNKKRELIIDLFDENSNVNNVDSFMEFIDVMDFFSNIKELKTKIYFCDEDDINKYVGVMKRFFNQGLVIYYLDNLSSKSFLVTANENLLFKMFGSLSEFEFQKIKSIEELENMKMEWD